MDVAALARSVGNTPTTSDLDWEEIDVTPVTRLLLGGQRRAKEAKPSTAQKRRARDVIVGSINRGPG